MIIKTELSPDAVRVMLHDMAAAGPSMGLSGDCIQALEAAEALYKKMCDGLLLQAEFPIGTNVYQLNKSRQTITQEINGVEWHRETDLWHVTTHKYSWIDAMSDAERPDRRHSANKHYYLSKAEALAKRDVLNSVLSAHENAKKEE